MQMNFHHLFLIFGKYFNLNKWTKQPMIKVKGFDGPGSYVAFPISGFSFGFPKGREIVMLRESYMANPQSVNTSTPAGHGFSMPAEWEPHAATWLAWPHHEADWPGKMEAVRWVYGEMVAEDFTGRNSCASSSGTGRNRNWPPAI